MSSTKQRLLELEKKSEKIQEELTRKEQELFVVRNEIVQLENDQRASESLLEDLQAQQQQIDARLRTL